MMQTFTETGQARSSFKFIKLLLNIIVISLLTLQPMATGFALGPGPDPGPDPGPGPDIGPGR